MRVFAKVLGIISVFCTAAVGTSSFFEEVFFEGVHKSIVPSKKELYLNANFPHLKNLPTLQELLNNHEDCYLCIQRYAPDKTENSIDHVKFSPTCLYNQQLLKSSKNSLQWAAEFEPTSIRIDWTHYHANPLPQLRDVENVGYLKIMWRDRPSRIKTAHFKITTPKADKENSKRTLQTVYNDFDHINVLQLSAIQQNLVYERVLSRHPELAPQINFEEKSRLHSHKELQECIDYLLQKSPISNTQGKTKSEMANLALAKIYYMHLACKARQIYEAIHVKKLTDQTETLTESYNKNEFPPYALTLEPTYFQAKDHLKPLMMVEEKKVLGLGMQKVGLITPIGTAIISNQEQHFAYDKNIFVRAKFQENPNFKASEKGTRFGEQKNFISSLPLIMVPYAAAAMQKINVEPKDLPVMAAEEIDEGNSAQVYHKGTFLHRQTLSEFSHQFWQFVCYKERQKHYSTRIVKKVMRIMKVFF